MRKTRHWAKLLAATSVQHKRTRFRGGIITVVTLGGSASAEAATIISGHWSMEKALVSARQLRALGETSACAEWADDFFAAGGSLSGFSTRDERKFLGDIE